METSDKEWKQFLLGIAQQATALEFADWIASTKELEPPLFRKDWSTGEKEIVRK